MLHSFVCPGVSQIVFCSLIEADNELPQDPADIPQSEQGKDEPASAGSVGSETRSKDQVHSRRGSRANEHTLGDSSASHPLRRDSGVGITASESQTMSDDSEFPAGQHESVDPAKHSSSSSVPVVDNHSGFNKHNTVVNALQEQDTARASCSPVLLARLKEQEKKIDQLKKQLKKEICEKREVMKELDEFKEMARKQQKTADRKIEQKEQELEECKKIIAELEKKENRVKELEEDVTRIREEITNIKKNNELENMKLQCKLSEAEKKLAEKDIRILEQRMKIVELERKIAISSKDAEIERLQQKLQDAGIDH